MLFFYKIFSFANFNKRFFSPILSNLIFALIFCSLPSRPMTWPFPNFRCSTLSPTPTFELKLLFDLIEDIFLKLPFLRIFCFINGVGFCLFWSISKSLLSIKSIKSLSISSINLLSSQEINFPHLYLELAYDIYRFFLALVIPT